MGSGWHCPKGAAVTRGGLGRRAADPVLPEVCVAWSSSGRHRGGPTQQPVGHGGRHSPAVLVCQVGTVLPPWDCATQSSWSGGFSSTRAWPLPPCGLWRYAAGARKGEEACVSSACFPDNGMDAEGRRRLPKTRWEQHKPFRVHPREPRSDESSGLVLGAGPPCSGAPNIRGPCRREVKCCHMYLCL